MCHIRRMVLRPSISLKSSYRVLEVTHNNCLRQLVGFRIAHRQLMDKVREACGLPSLREVVVKHTMSWLGHVSRMHPTKYCTPGLFKLGTSRQAAMVMGGPSRVMSTPISTF